MLNHDLILNEVVPALRSGEFEQTNGFLRLDEADGLRPAGYCCLGVMCELARRNHGIGYWGERLYKSAIRPFVAVRDNGVQDTSVNVLPVSIREHYGFSDAGGDDYVVDGEEDHLFGWNDRGLPFEEIADLLVERCQQEQAALEVASGEEV